MTGPGAVVGAKFYFFTDPALLDPQAAQQAYGPAGTSGGKDRFRVTDVHSSTATAVPAFAVCDGIVCAQKDANGTLSLILKPTQQPPFDFPFISYIIYKGIDPASLLALDGTIDTAQQTSNELIAAIKTAWELEANGNTGSPSRACLGLHLNPTDYPQADNPARFADTEPIDRLFYEGDPAIQLPLVRGSWRLGNFSSSFPFGIEIVVERIGRRPKIALARKADNVIEVDTLVALADDAAVFRHWDAKEAILGFVDPCAFWGAFFAARLCVWDGANSFDKLSGNAIYETVLRGAVGGGGNFANRNRACLDIRNEHGNSLNYYQADGPNIQLTLDASADIDACEVNYYASGWPSFTIDNTNLPAGATGDKIDVRFALPKTANTRPLIYISAGYRGAFRRLKDARRFLDKRRRADVPYLEEASITIPLIDDTGTKIPASYQKIVSFKRPLIVNGIAVSANAPGSLAPAYVGLLDHVFPVLGDDEIPLGNKPTIARTFAEERYVTNPTAEYGGFVAKLTIAEDIANRYWMLTPYVYYRWPGATSVFDGATGSPSMTLSNANQFLADYAARRTPRELRQITVTPPLDALSQAPVAVAIPGPGPTPPRRFAGRAFERTVILCLLKSDVDQLLANLATDSPLPGTIFLLPGPAESFAAGNRRYTRLPLSASYIKTSPLVARVTVATSLEVYADANL